MTKEHYNPILSRPKNEWQTDKHIVIKVHRVTAHKMAITWTEIPYKYFPNKDSVGYLEVSDSPTDGFKAIETITRDHPPMFLDTNSILNFYRYPVIYYRLVFPDIKAKSIVFSSEKMPNMYGLEISRRHAIMLREGHSGNLMYLFIKKRSEERCPDCFDFLRGQRSSVDCPTCMNTGIIGGYYDPLPLYVSVSPESVSVTLDLKGPETMGQLQCWTTGFPRLEVGDVLVDSNTRDLWMVQQVSITTHKRTPTKQDFVLKYYTYDQEVYKLLERVPMEADKKNGRHGEASY